MSSVTSQGEMLEYISNIEFSLNFEDSKSSVKVRIGDIVKYDGTVAKYKKSSGEEIIGKTPSLRSAIASNWLTLNVDGAQRGHCEVKAENYRICEKTPDKSSDHVPSQVPPQFDRLRGGDFDKFLNQDTEIARPVTGRVIKENDRVVKKFPTVGDQVSVRDVAESTTVTSSTAISKTAKAHGTKVIASEHYGSEGSIDIKFKSAGKTPENKSNSFMVDGSTSRLPEDATMKEINRITRPVVQAAESQDAVIVKKVSKAKVEVTEIDGVVLKNTVGTSDQDIDTSVRVSSGSTAIADLSGVSTQEQADQASGAAAEITAKREASKAKYLEMLPEDWSKMHWVKKEQFIKQLDDREFIKFILTVEPVKAVQNACRKRLVEIEKLAMQK